MPLHLIAFMDRINLFPISFTYIIISTYKFFRLKLVALIRCGVSDLLRSKDLCKRGKNSKAHET